VLEYSSPVEIPGWMGKPELTYLYNMVIDAPPDALIVELGAWLGLSTAALYKGMHDRQTVVTVDTWLGQPDLREVDHHEALERDIFLEFLDYMSLIDIHLAWWTSDQVGACYLRMHSVDAASLFQDGSINRAFIDCDHRLVGTDIDVLLPKMAPDGEISGHDLNWGGVKEQVEQRIEITDVIGDIWIAAPIIRK